MGSRFGTVWQGAARGLAALVALAVATAWPVAAQVGYGEGFESCGEEPAGWFDSAPGNPTQQAPGQFKVWADPRAGGNHAFGKRGASDSYSHYRDATFGADSAFLWTGRVYRERTASLAGMMFFSTAPSPVAYFQLGQVASNGTVRLSAVNRGALEGDVETGVVLTPNRWFRFAIAAAPSGDGVRITASVWPDGDPQPESWQVDATAPGSPAGWIGLWASGNGSKLWDDFDVAGGGGGGEPLAIEIRESGAPLEDGAVFARAVTPTIATTGGTAPIETTATLDGAPFASGTTVDADGDHTLAASASDAAGGSASATVHFTIDRTGPVFLSVLPADGSVTAEGSVTLSGEVSGAETVTVDGAAASLAGNLFTAGPFALAEGERTFLLVATDAAGNATERLHRIVRDGTAPELTVQSPTPGAVVGATPIAVSGTAVDPRLASVTVNGQPASVGGAVWVLAALDLVPGANAITVRAVDSVGNAAEVALEVTLDAEPPVVRLLESGAPLADGALFDRPVTPVIETEDATAVTVEATLDGAPFVSGSTVAADGEHLLTVIATDAGGSTTAVSVRFRIDTTPPAFVSTQPESGALVATSELTITGVVSGATTVTVDGTPATLAGDAFSAGPFALSDGPRTFQLVASDEAGNSATLALMIERDGTAPTLAVTSPAPGTVVAAATIDVAGTVADPHLDEVRVAGIPAVVAGGQFTAAGVPLAEGGNDLVVVARDTLGNSVEVTVAVTRDSEPPAVTILEQGVPLVDGALFARAVVPVVEATDATEVTLVLRLDGQPFVSGTSVSAEGERRLDVEATDEAGNLTARTVRFTIDTTAPVLASVEPPSGTVTREATVVVSGRAVGAATVTVDGVEVPLAGDAFASAPIALAEGERTIPVVATDAAGNQATQSVSVVRDTTAPTLAITQPAAGAVTGAAATEVVGTVSDPNLDAVTVNGVAAAVTGGSFVAAGVPLAEGLNTLTARAVDRAGNAAEASRDVERDSTAPTVAILDPAAGTVVPDATIEVRGTATDAHLDRVEVQGVPAALADEQWSIEVALSEGETTVVARAIDTLGRDAEASVVVRRDSTAPELEISAPAEGARIAAAEVAVEGTVEVEEGLTVTVNGVAATVTGGTFTATVPLAAGENRLIARARDASGNTGTRTRIVWRDDAAPRLLSADPPDGAIGLGAEARFRLTFSEPMAAPAAGAVVLESADGTPIAATATVSAATIELVPAAALPSAATLRLRLTTALVDLSGRALEAEQLLSFETSDGEAPAPPVVAPGTPERLCGATVVILGSAEPTGTVEATGGAWPVSAPIDSAGGFELAVPLAVERPNALALTVVDATGNRSDAASLTVVHDCTPPRVLAAIPAALPAAQAVTIVFSEELDAASITGAVTVDDLHGPLAGTEALGADAASIVWSAAEPLPETPFRVEVSTAVTDLAGNPLAYPWSQLLGGGAAASFLAGVVLDDATGRPLEGVRVQAFRTNGAPLAPPWPEQTSGPDGRFSLAMPAGTHQVLFERAGYTTAWRTVTTEPDRGTDVFDPRLAPLGLPETVADGGAVLARAAAPGGVAALTLDVPAGAYAAPTAVALVSLSEQGLPALLPYGWSPRAAVWWWGVAPAAAPSTLTLEVEPGVAPHRALVRFDLAALGWRVEQVLDPATTLAVVESAGDGAWAVVDADPAPFVVPAPAPGQLLPSLAPPPFDLVTAAAIVFTPETVLPDQTALAEVSYSGSDEAASGTPLALSIAEQLELLDGTVRIEPPYPADLILYRAADGTAGSAFRLKPSEAARLLPLDQGEEQVAVAHYAGETVRGNVLGPDGGTVTDEDGNRIDLPAGALLAPTPVALAAVDPVAAGAPLPSWLEAVAALDVDLSGRTLAQSATLTFAVSPAPGAGERGLVLERFATPDGPRWRPVAAAEPVAEGWRSALAAPAGWPGIRGGGVFLVARAIAPFGYFSGRVFDVTGIPLDGAGVDATTSGTLRQRSGPAGAYLLPAAVGATQVSARESLRNNGVTVDSAVPADGAVVPLDLALAVVAPTVVLVTPADGAVEIPVGVEPQVRFSESIDPATASAIELLTANGSAVPVDRVVQGALVTLVPDGDLEAGTAHEIAIGAGVRDLQGYSLGTAVSSIFTTALVAQPGGLDPSRVLLYEPDAAGQARIEGLAGALDPGLLVFVENLTRLAATESTEAGPAGQFELAIEAEVGDHLRLHVLIPGANEVVLTLGPWRTADGRGAWIGPAGARITTVDGWVLDVPPAAFAVMSRIVVTPRPSSAPAPAQPETLVRAAGFALDFGGAVAGKPIELTLPAPVGTPDAEHLVLREVSGLGRRGWMLHAFARFANGTLTTEEAPEPLGGLPALTLPVGGKPGDAPESPEGLRPTGSRTMLPGLAFAGNYTVSYPTEPLGFFALPLVAGVDVVIQTSLEGLLSVVNGAIAALLEGDALLIPTRIGAPVSFTIFDLGTGFALFEGEFEPPADDGGLAELPPALYGDEEPPHPVSGSPLRFLLVTAEPGRSGSLGLGIGYATTDSSLTLTGAASALPGGLQARLIGLDDEVEVYTTAAADGAFSLTAPTTPGNRYLVALGARVTGETALIVEFDEPMAAGFAGIDVIDASGNSVAPLVAAGDTYARAVVRPRGAWSAGEKLRLELAPELADASGNRWEKRLTVEFEVEASGVADTYLLGRAQDLARLGNLLFVAADEQGLAVLDVSDPANLESVLPGGATFLFPMQDLVRGVAVDPHGRVLVAGGGSRNFGILRIFDPLRLPEILAAPDPIAARGLAWRGTTIVADRVGGSGTQLPAGYPRRVAALSNDLTSRWTAGQPAPDGLEVTLVPPSTPQERPRVRVAGGGASPGAPVTLRNLDRLGWERVDADGAGAFVVELTAEAGDRLELLRNRETYAYVATLGAGIELVDVNSFYRPDDTPGPGWSDVIGLYSGAGDPNLILCNQQVPELSAALIDLGGLFEAEATPQLTAVSLVAYRGLALVGSEAADLDELRFVGDACAQVAGSRAVFGLETAQDLGLDVDGDGAISQLEREKDWALVAHGVGGLLVYDVTERAEPQLRARVPLPGTARHLGLDRQTLRVYVATGSQGLLVVDLSGPLSVGLMDADGDGLDDRLIEQIALPGVAAGAPVEILPELGLVFAGGEGGVSSVAAGRPRLEALAPEIDGSWRRLTELAPLGVPAPGSDPRSGAAALRVRAAIPGVASPELRMRIAGTSAAGLTIDVAGLDAELPRPELAGEADGLLFSRLSDRLWEEGSSVFLSEEVAVVADLRAARAYERTGRENDATVPGHCVRCDRAALGIDPEARELLSGDDVRVTFQGELGQRLTDLYGPARLATSELALPSVRWETAPSLRQEPTLGPSLGGGEVVPGTLLHSGEFRHDATDLYVRGRGLDFAFTRTYRNQTVGGGPLGPGWDFAYRMRLRELPNGDVELYDGGGRRETFRKVGTAWEAPPGRFVDFERTAAGWRLTDPSHTVLTFDARGLLVSIADPVRQSESSGNEIRFTHDARGRLTTVTDPLGRRYELAYTEDGRIEAVTDFTGREVAYEYDGEGRLERVTSPRVELGVSKFPNGLVTRYEYAPGGGGLTARLATRDNLVALVDARGQVPVELAFEDLDGDGRGDEVATERWGGHDLSITYDFPGRVTTVTDRRGFPWITRHNAAGQVVSTTDPFPATTQYEVDGEGLVTRVTAPLGRQTVITYDANGERRARGNALSTAVTADGRGPNGSSPTLTTTVEYDPYSNQPVRIVDPRGAVTEIERDGRGLPTKITEAFGAPEAGRTLYQYDAFGRPVQVTNANDHVTTYAYHESGASRGYLRETVVDPGGLAIATRYETDGRGNVTAVTDPRGVRHLTRYNELDWPFESVQAATAATDGSGAPALGYTTTLLHDANGNVIEQRIPYGEHGEIFTRVITDYGILNEARTVAREIEPGGEQALEHLAYDVNFNLEQTEGAEGQLTRSTFDARNLLDTVTRGVGSVDASTVIHAYDAEGSRVSFTDGRLRTSVTVIDGYGRVAERRDALGHRSTTSYDDGGQPRESRSLDADGELLSRARTDYDLRGRATAHRSYLWTETTPEEEVVSRTHYDPLGNVVSQVDPRQNATTIHYDAAERVVETIDALGNKSSSTLDAAGNTLVSTLTESTEDGPVSTAVTARFDALGRPIERVDPLGNWSRTAYDARGRAIRRIDPEGNLTTSRYDGLDRLTGTVRPEGISVDYGYDRSGRLLTYRDALNQTTSYGYDELDRRRSTTWPDARTETVDYDAAGNPIRLVDGLGTEVAQSYDDANRLTSRVVTPAAGVEGPVSETYSYDGLSRLRQAVSGGVTSAFTYDSLSRRTSETTNGRTVAFEHDAAGNRTLERYPSGLELERTFDELNRPQTVGPASYGYRGPDLVASKSRAGVTQRFGYDAARRLVESTERLPGGATAHRETIAWTPRGLKASISRSDSPGASQVLGYDGAGRLTATANLPELAATTPNNSLPPAGVFESALGGRSFSYDAAENLLARTDRESGIAETTSLPLDGSGRNRPGSVDGMPLAWDGNGNLISKGDLEFHYDFRNRLTRVSRGSEEVARYRYDAFNRKIETVAGGEARETVWSGWQAIETRGSAGLSTRRVYGVGLDEIVRQEVDIDGDGTAETAHLPVYDSTGSLVAILDEAGKPIERYDYSPYGERTIRADLTVPELEQVRMSGGALWLEASERVSAEHLETLVASGALRLENLTTTTTVPIVSLEVPVQQGRQAGRRVVLALGQSPATGNELRLTLPAGALQDDFLNANPAEVQPTWTWSGADEVVLDTRAPAISEVRIRSGRVEIELTEEVDPQSANSTVTIDGEPTTWDLAEDRYTLRSLAEVSPGGHTVSLAPGIEDLAGRSQPEPLDVTFPAGLSAHAGYRRPDPTVIPTSSAANAYGFHGHEADPATGLVYMRNRWYDPQMGRFVTADPLGYVDGVNRYSFAFNAPLQMHDSLGLFAESGHYYTVLLISLRLGFEPKDAFALAFGAQFPDEVEELDARENFMAALDETSRHPLNSDRAVRREMVRVHQENHALTGGVSVLESDRAAAAATSAPTLFQAGIQLHRLGDSFAHRQEGNEMFLYKPGAGHLFDQVSPDIIQERPDLYLGYVRSLASTLSSIAESRGLRPVAGRLLSGLPEVARRPISGARHWYLPETYEEAQLESWTIEKLRALIAEVGQLRGLQSEVESLLRYRPELSRPRGKNTSDVFGQAVNSVGNELAPSELK